MLKKVEFNEQELNLLRTSVLLHIDSLKRQLNKHPAGTALHTAFKQSVDEAIFLNNRLIGV